MKNMIDQIIRTVPRTFSLKRKGKIMTVETTVPPTKKRSNFFYRKPEIDETRKIEVVRQDGNGNEIRKTCGSIGFQVFVGGKFKTFVTGLEEANNVLDAFIANL